ncbi:MAG: hypothetical protein CBB97_00495 [Candidatus Endolissoclinum sp. TMED37]|nr:MAG: hypothetical protein CBB97_00495 [Candidatus Endolissoclinum sp. TMED37]|tara:strand:+ start:3863 stop:4150 length:288 start_codon:yes stop_codon:yes gene_type:complete
MTIGEYIIPTPLGEYVKTVSDNELIEAVSVYEARRQFVRWTINAATTAYYDCVVNEWNRRYNNRHLPRMPFTFDDVRHFADESIMEIENKNEKRS